MLLEINHFCTDIIKLEKREVQITDLNYSVYDQNGPDCIDIGTGIRTKCHQVNLHLNQTGQN